jgi:hypothetical protein
MSLSHKGQSPWIAGKKHTPESRDKMRVAQLGMPKSEAHRLASAMATKIAMHRPDVRERHVKALAETKWFGKSVDRGQMGVLSKWNSMGFKFVPNYQIHTDTDLFYVDGYDEGRNVVMEYDSKYHHRAYQQRKDLDRQQKIIGILKPKKFWRYDAINRLWKNVLERNG